MLHDLARADRVQGALFDPGALNTEAADQLLKVVRTYLR
jgi:hypothetical protein